MAAKANKKDFFISRNKADAAWAKWIAWQLEEAGYTTVLQDWDFRPSQNFVLRMQEAATSCERTIAVLSDAFLESGFTQPEWAATFAQDPTGEKGLLLLVRVEKCEPKGLLPQIIYLDLVDLSEEQARDALLAGVERERAKPKSEPDFPIPAAQPSPGPRFPGALPPTWNVPHRRNKNFTGRDDLLTQLRDELASGEPAAITQAISGLGGVGKTQLATEYCYRHASDYERVWWVRSEEPTTLAADYAALAVELNLEEKEETDQRVITEAVRRWLDHNGGWLIVFDNVPRPEEVRDYLPHGASGHVIVTSRNPSWGSMAKPLSVHEWDRDESVEFLLKRTGQDDEEAADALANELGDLPLALEQAAAYVEESACPIAHYLALFRERHADVLARGKAPEGYEHTIATTWDLSFEQVAKENDTAADLLNLCAFLAPDDVPLDIIRERAEHLPERLATAARDDVAWDKAIAALRRYSLAEVSGDALSVHRLVQAAARGRLVEDAKRTWAEAAVQLINGAFPSGIQTDLDTWPICARLLSHALTVAAHGEDLNVASEASVRLLALGGLYLRGRAQNADARAAYERALPIAESCYGLDHPEVATIVSGLGVVLLQMGDPAAARKHTERALRIDEAAFGANNPAVALDVNNLGGILEALGDLTGARAAFERALRIAEQAYGTNHRYVAFSVNNLGNVLRNLGELAEAQAHYERALRIDENVFPEDHPEMAVHLSNLGGVLLALGDLAGARGHYERALCIFRRLLGDDHPDTVTTRKNLDGLPK